MVIKRVKKLAKKAVTPRKHNPLGTGQGALSKQDWEKALKRIRELEKKRLAK